MLMQAWICLIKRLLLKMSSFMVKKNTIIIINYKIISLTCEVPGIKN